MRAKWLKTRKIGWPRNGYSRSQAWAYFEDTFKDGNEVVGLTKPIESIKVLLDLDFSGTIRVETSLV